MDKPLYVISTEFTGEANLVDPMAENSVCELHIQLNKATTRATNVVVLSYTDTLTEIDGSGTVAHSDA